MTGLASKWATEPTLVKQAEVQDSKIAAKVATEKPQKSSKASEPKSNTPSHKPLVSKWADAPPKTSVEESKKTQKNKRPGSHDGKGHRNRRNSDSHKHEEHNQDSNRNRDRRRGRNDNRKRPDGKIHEETTSRTDRDEPLPPMSKAAANFALRLGVPVQDNNADKYESDGQYETTDEEVDVPAGSYDKGHSAPKQPMSKAAASFASRLGTPQKETGGSQGSGKKYMSPKQRQEVAKKQQEERRLQEQKLRDAKLQEEVRDMFSKMTSTSANWADLEDE